MDLIHDPACTGCVCRASFRNAKTGKVIRARDYGLKAFCFCPYNRGKKKMAKAEAVATS
jgi:hypothetical protein